MKHASYSRISLFLIVPALVVLLLYILKYSIDLINQQEQAKIYGINYVTLESISFFVFFVMLVVILTTLPVILISTYTQIRVQEIRLRTLINLAMCGLTPAKKSVDKPYEFDTAIESFILKNRNPGYILPGWIMALLLFIFWGLVFAPRGLTGAQLAFGQGGEIRWRGDIVTMLGVPEILDFFVQYSSPVTWAFLGAYFYILTSLIRRWAQSDLTVGFVWRANARLIIVLILGLLLLLSGDATQPILEKTDSQESFIEVGRNSEGVAFLRERHLSDTQRGLMLVAFFGGIMPNSVLYWVSTRLKALGNINGSSNVQDWAAGLFSPPEIQRDIDGLSFWQADRLSEEGIETVGDLASEDLLDLMVNTRFEGRQLVGWMDQAILYAQRSRTLLPICYLRDVGVWRATDLLDIWYWCMKAQPVGAEVPPATMERRMRFVETLALALVAEDNPSHSPLVRIEDEKRQYDMIYAAVENIVNGIEIGSNISYICNFWQNDTAEKRNEIGKRIQDILQNLAAQEKAAPVGLQPIPKQI